MLSKIVLTTKSLIILAVVSALSGIIGGMGGPSGIPVLFSLHILTDLPPSVAAATGSSAFFFASLAGTLLYHTSSDINWKLTVKIGLPAAVGTYLGSFISSILPQNIFTVIFSTSMMLVSFGIIYDVKSDKNILSLDYKIIQSLTIFGSFLIGTISGIIGIGGPALIIPFLLILGIKPSTAIGSGIASGILISSNSIVGHAIHGNYPNFLLVITITLTLVSGMVGGWKFVQSVNENKISLTLAIAAALGSVGIILL